MQKALQIALAIFCCSFSEQLFAQETDRAIIYKHLQDKNTHDTVRAANILAYSFTFPSPSFDSILPLLDDSYKTALKFNKKALAQQLLSRKIWYYVHSGKGMYAFTICQDLLKLGEKENDNAIIADSYYQRANIFQSYNMLGRAAEEQKKCIEYNEKAGRGLAVADGRYLLAYYSFNNKDYSVCLPNFRAAYAYTIKNDSKNYTRLGEYSNWLGNTFRQLKQYDSALYYSHIAKGYFTIEKPTYGFGDVHRYIGIVHLRVGNYDSALYYFNTAKTVFQTAGIQDRQWLMQYFLAETYNTKKDHKKAAKELDGLLKSLKGYRDVYTLYESSNLGTIVYEKNNEYNKAIECYKNVILYKDTIEKTDRQGALTELDAKFQFEQQENENKLRQATTEAEAAKKAEKQALIRNFLIGGFCILALFLIVVYRNYKEKQKANKLLQVQKTEIEHQKKEIQDSINYAQNIQAAVLPDQHEIEKYFSDMFILYKPKDVVSGDFFWFSKTEETVLIAAADCTGHGVPGAFMSMIGSYELNNSVTERGITEPYKILSHINPSLKKRLKQYDEQNKNKDGMDIALCAFDLKKLSLQYAGANRPLYLIRNNEPIEYAPTKTAIGGYTDDTKQFDDNIISLKKGDCIYMYTDGYSDQFGGAKNKKLTTKRFKALIQSVSSLPMKEQHGKLEAHFYEWKGHFEQLDDVLVIGIRI